MRPAVLTAAEAAISPALDRFEFVSLGQADDECIAACLLSLDPEDRLLRFHGTAPDRRILNYVASIDWPRWFGVGCVRAGQLVGVAEAAVGRGRYPAADVGVAVVAQVRRRGLGRALVTRVLKAAARGGAATAVLAFNPVDPRVAHIVRSLGARIDSLEGEATVQLVGGWTA